MDFNTYLKQRINTKTETGKTSFGSLTRGSAASQLANISLFQSASLKDLKDIDIIKLLKSENIDDAIAKDATADQKALAEIVKAFMEIGEVQEIADANGDGKLTGKEALKYLEGLMNNDGEKGTLSISDIDKEINSLGINLESIVEDAIKDVEKEEEVQQPQSTGSAGGGGGVSGGGYSSRAGNSGATQAAAKQETTAEDIEAQISTEESKKSDLKTQMDADIAEQEKVISEAMEDKDSGFPEGFKEKYEQEKAKIEEDIKAKDTEVETQKGIVQDKTAEISALSTSISTLGEQKSALEAQLGSISSDAENADEQRSAINTKITNVQNEINSKTEAKEKAEKDKEAAEKAQEKAENEKKELVSKKDNLLDTMIKENKLKISPEVQNKIQEAQGKIQEIRSTAETEIAACDTKIQELKTQLQELKEKEDTDKIVAENSVYSGSIPAELAASLDARLGDGFCARLEEIAQHLNCDPTDLLGMMNSESGIDPTAVNGSSGATGLIQFMPSTAEGLGTTTEALRNMSAIEQLDYVEKFFDGNLRMAGIPSGQRLEAGTLYALVFLPACANNEVLTYRGDGHGWYEANSGLDTDGNGDISISDLTVRVQNKYKELLS